MNSATLIMKFLQNLILHEKRIFQIYTEGEMQYSGNVRS